MKKPAPELTLFIGAIRNALQSVPRMSEATDTNALFATAGGVGPPDRKFRLRSPEAPLALRVADHFDLKVDALVHDGELGTLGLIHYVTEGGDGRAQLRQWIDEAAYVRHLLLEDLRPGSVQAGKSPYAVEVVLVLSPAEGAQPDPNRPAGAANPTASSSRPASSDVGDVLRDIVREGSYLHAVGVNLWRLPGADLDARKESGFRRAFSWLMVDAERWYADAPAAPAAAPAGTVRAVRLRNFRVAGSRHWELAPDCALHLIHGHNGSGKSSLCEALELIVTGKVERLEGASPAEVITNRTARRRGLQAGITLERMGDPPREWALNNTGIDSPLAGDLVAGSFRMDQRLADALSHGDSAARARLFLAAFFARESSELAKRDAVLKRATELFETLPQRLKPALMNETSRLDPARALAALQWLGGETAPREELLRLLPFDSVQLAAVRALLSPDLASKLGGTGPLSTTEIDEVIRAIDPALRGLAENAERKIAVLNEAVLLLQEFGDASISAAGVETDDLGRLLNRWLEHLALTDLMERESRVLAAIDEARQRGFVFDPARAPALTGLTKDLSAEDRRKVIADVRSRRDELRLRVAGFRTAEERASRADKPLPPIDHRRPAALDDAAGWGAFGPTYAKVTPPLGAAVREAFVRRHVVDVKTASSVLLRVGEPGWGKELLSLAQRSRETFQVIAAWQSELLNPIGCLQSMWTALRQLYDCVHELAAFDAVLLKKFLELIGNDSPLSRAVNEVMALLTPARWAYEDIATRADLAGGEQRLDVQTTDNIPAKLRLNTAELNTFALTLFLLCARRAPNPLRMIVLDDPLQNMDELTVTTLARGLGRMLRLWRRANPDDAWRILILLHSEGSLERIRNEIHCAAYVLPWLSPHDEPSDPALAETQPAAGKRDPRRIRPLRPLLQPRLQALNQLMREVPGRPD